MNKKSGVTMTVLAISLAIMLLLITSSTIIGVGHVNDAKFDAYKTMVSTMSDNINAYFVANGKLPITNDVIVYTNYSEDFAREVISKGDQYNRLYVVNVDLLVNYTVEEGRGTVSDGDVFIVAENTNNVYYLKGFEYKNKLYYGM